MARKEPSGLPQSKSTTAHQEISLLLEPLLGIHTAPNQTWLADATATAAERGLSALYCLLYLKDTSGLLVGVRPASSQRMRVLAKVQQLLKTDVATLKFDPKERPALGPASEGNQAIALVQLSEALVLTLDTTQAQDAQRQLGVARVWVTPLAWNGESYGLLLLLMPADPPCSIVLAELLGRHVAVALGNLRAAEVGRQQGGLDPVRWVQDERRFLEQLTQEIQRAKRHNRPLSIMLMRIQRLDELRARYGRFRTEQALRQVGGLLSDAMRDTDFLGAFQDDAFATILVEADHDGAIRARERLRANVEALKSAYGDLSDLGVQLDCATATLAADGETAEELAAAAQTRLMEQQAAA